MAFASVTWARIPVTPVGSVATVYPGVMMGSVDVIAVLLMVNRVAAVWSVVPEPVVSEVWNTSVPGVPVPVPREPRNVQAAPAISVPLASWTLRVWATGGLAAGDLRGP